jgi:hypothetical protein
MKKSIRNLALLFLFLLLILSPTSISYAADFPAVVGTSIVDQSSDPYAGQLVTFNINIEANGSVILSNFACGGAFERVSAVPISVEANPYEDVAGLSGQGTITVKVKDGANPGDVGTISLSTRNGGADVAAEDGTNLLHDKTWRFSVEEPPAGSTPTPSPTTTPTPSASVAPTAQPSATPLVTQIVVQREEIIQTEVINQTNSQQNTNDSSSSNEASEKGMHTIDLTGQILNDDFFGMSGLVVALHPRQQEIITNENGMFTFANIQLNDSVLIFGNQNNPQIGAFALCFVESDKSYFVVTGQIITCFYTKEAKAIHLPFVLDSETGILTVNASNLTIEEKGSGRNGINIWLLIICIILILVILAAVFWYLYNYKRKELSRILARIKPNNLKNFSNAKKLKGNSENIDRKRKQKKLKKIQKKLNHMNKN